jgi:DinB family protein
MSTPPRFDRPGPGEFDQFFAAYISKVPDGDLVQGLEAQGRETAKLLRGVPESRGGFAYAPGKWTLKEVVGHVADAERVFSYRALRIARGDQTPLASFNEQAWTPQSGASARTLGDLVDELGAVRGATLALLAHLPAEAPLRRGTASGKEISVRALAWIIAGHERHHLGVIRERYL